MSVEPYCSARTVFWIVNNGSSHAGNASIERLEGAYDNLRLIHLPIYASWLNQNRALLLDRPAESAHPERVRLARGRSPSGCSPSAPTTGRSRSRSNRLSPAPTSMTSSHGSTLTSPASRSRHDHRTCGGVC
jgi:hypothetical protein